MGWKWDDVADAMDQSGLQFTQEETAEVVGIVTAKKWELVAVLEGLAAAEDVEPSHGHPTAAQALGLRWELFVRFPVSFGVRAEQSRLVAAAGPVASFLLASAAYAVGWQDFCFLSAGFGLVSLPPFKPFDGYWIFRHMALIEEGEA